MTMGEDESQQQGASQHPALTTLQPIRDLAKNWDIDIASCLEEYLHDLVGHLPIEERRKVAADASLDFTEAALVLQNSSNIYSRKVDYFYTLVYQALNDLAGSVDAASGAGQHNNKRNKTAGDIEIDDFHAFDPHQEFLLLDDVLPVDETDNCEKINLPESIDDASMTRTNRLSMNQPTGMTASTGKNQNQNQTARLSLGVTLGGDFSTTMDRSVQSMNAAAHRALIGSLDTGSLRLIDGQCDIDESGVLLMPGTASQRSTTNFSSQETMPQNDLVAHDDNEFGGGNHDDYDEGDDDGGGFAFGDDQEMPPAPEAFSETHNRVSFAETLNQPQKKKRADPWELLDPHTPDSVKARPLRIGKTIKLPPGVDELPSDCVTGARTRRATRRKKVPLPPVLEKPTKSLATEIFKATMAARKRSHNETSLDDEFVGVDEEAASFPSVPLKGLVFGDEFAYIAKASAKRKAAERRERRKQQLATNVPSVPEEDDNYDNDDDGGFAFGGMDDGDDGDDGDFGGAFDNDNNGSVVGNTGMASVDEVYDAQGNLDDSNPETQTFEELCRAHIQKFARGAEKYAAETQLSLRVGHWQERLSPLLQEEEQRPEFDIHAYGRTVIDSMEQEIRRHHPKSIDDTGIQDATENNTVDFQKVTRHCQQYEVCRMFLASLSLSNSGNVELVAERDDQCTSLQLSLVRKDIERPMETYFAPSAVEASASSLTTTAS